VSTPLERELARAADGINARGRLSNYLHYYVYGELGDSICDVQIISICNYLDELRNGQIPHPDGEAVMCSKCRQEGHLAPKCPNEDLSSSDNAERLPQGESDIRKAGREGEIDR
jgi:hypothetical protein